MSLVKKSSLSLRSEQTYQVFDLDTKNTFTIDNNKVIFDFPVNGSFEAEYDPFTKSIVRGDTTLYKSSDLKEIFQPKDSTITYTGFLQIGNYRNNIVFEVLSCLIPTMILTTYDNSKHVYFVENNDIFEAIKHDRIVDGLATSEYQFGKKIGSLTNIYEVRTMFPNRFYDIRLMSQRVIRVKTIQTNYSSPVLVEITTDDVLFEKGFYFNENNKIQMAKKQWYKDSNGSTVYKYFVDPGSETFMIKVIIPIY